MTADLTPLFDGHRELRAVVDAVLEGRLGSAVPDDAASPRAARLSIGCYEIFGGDARASAARRLVETAPPERELVYGNDPAWRRLLLDVHGARLFDRPMRAFDASRLDADGLREQASWLEPEFSMRPLDVELARQLDDELAPHALQTYPSVDAFVAEGIGFGVLAGGRVVCAATSYTRSSTAVEVAIATRAAFRGRGLAEAASAQLMAVCLAEGLMPCWNASNPVSQRLAARLGYDPAGTCEVLYFRRG
jgi:GNAT superfamily N-acetyltransferase